MEADEWLCDPAAEDLGEELLKLHRSLQACNVDLLHCLVRSPSEHGSHLRRLNQIVRNMASLLHSLRAREARALVLQSLRKQVSRKRSFAEAARASLPRMEARLARAMRSGDAGGEDDESEGEEPAAAPPPAPGSEPSSSEEGDDFDSALLGLKQPRLG
uniref:Mediator of RNA polymerase II transcription subunit 7 n=1 Tax=Alexandrium catenella TaxID=2925 RepID=A0A7S1RPC1_ALECA